MGMERRLLGGVRDLLQARRLVRGVRDGGNRLVGEEKRGEGRKERGGWRETKLPRWVRKGGNRQGSVG